MTFLLPAEAGEFRQADAVPDFVVATQRWSVPDRGLLSVAVQDVVPLFPTGDLVSQFDANGLHWQAYETGTTEGSGTIAFAVVDGTSAALVGGQAWTGAESDSLIRSYVMDIARSLIYQGDHSDD